MIFGFLLSGLSMPTISSKDLTDRPSLIVLVAKYYMREASAAPRIALA